jgi:hypothetical protein
MSTLNATTVTYPRTRLLVFILIALDFVMGISLLFVGWPHLPQPAQLFLLVATAGILVTAIGFGEIRNELSNKGVLFAIKIYATIGFLLLSFGWMLRH